MTIESTLERIASALETLASRSPLTGNALDNAAGAAPAKTEKKKPAPAAEPAKTETKAETTAAPTADLDAIRKAMKNLITKNLRDSITETFSKYGASDASSLKAEHYGAVLEDLKAALALA